MGAMMKQAQKMQAELARAQEEIKDMTFEATAGGGMVKIRATAKGRILDVDYARLTREPDAVMREVSAFCGIDYVDAMRDPRSSTRAVATASALQVREGVVRRDQPKWAPYAHRLPPLADALARGGVSGS